MSASPTTTPTSASRRQPDHGFSVREARQIVLDLFEPVPWIFWTDFLLSITGGWICFTLLQRSPSLTIQAIAYVGVVLLFYRAGSFTHELVHLRTGTFKPFHVAWDVMCGIPLLMPSYMYMTHIAHHAKNHYATAEDGEYLPLAMGRVRGVVIYLGQAFALPIVAVVRFLVLAPLSWIFPALRPWVHQHASSLVMDPTYIRPLPSTAELRVWRVQEVCCFLIAAAATARLAFGAVGPWWLVKVYAIAVGVLLMNELRTLGAHRFRFDGSREVSFVEQLLDSVNYPRWPWLTELWAPIGLRFHALHHLFPSMPYHRLAEAHARLMAQLPADSPYRQTVSPGLLHTLGELLAIVRRNGSIRRNGSSDAGERQSTGNPSSADQVHGAAVAGP